MNFLRRIEPRIPTKDRPWLWPVNIDGIPYGIPCTRQDTAAGHAGYLMASNSGKGLNIRYMIPLPESALQPLQPLPPPLRWEEMHYAKIEDYIAAEAQLLHRLSCSGQMGEEYAKHSCDYRKLEQVYTAWQPDRNAGYFLCPEEERVMPISKNGKLFYTKEQYETAKYVNNNALEYAQKQGYDLIRNGNWYTMKEHDSMVFSPNGSWFWNSRGIHGGAIEFQMYYEGKTLTEAVLTLSGDREYQASGTQTQQVSCSKEPTQSTLQPPKRPFQLPPKAPNFRRLFYYLCRLRGLEKSVVQEMISQQKVYQSHILLSSGKIADNACFVYHDPQTRQPVGAYQRGMVQSLPGQTAYKRDVSGTDKRFGWILESPYRPAEVVEVYEGAIDAASGASIAALQVKDWKEQPIDRLSLEGCANYCVLENYLAQHPQVQQITLMLDADSAGRRAAAELAKIYTEKGYDVKNKCPKLGKDMNECLLTLRESASAEPAPQAEQSFPEETPVDPEIEP